MTLSAGSGSGLEKERILPRWGAYLLLEEW